MSTTPKQSELEIMKDLPDRECQNCGFVYDGYFCPRCGQRYMEGRFELKESTTWIMGQVLNLDKGFFHTTWELLLHPAKVINDYFSKATVRYMHPFRFMFIAATISALVTILSGAFESPDLAMFQGQQTPEELENTRKTMEFIQKYLSLIMMFTIPCYAVGSYLIYKDHKRNYTEHLILNSFSYALGLIVTLPLTLLVLIPGGLAWNSGLSTLISTILIGYVNARYFQESVLLGFVKAIGITLIGFIIAILSGVIFGVVGKLISLAF